MPLVNLCCCLCFWPISCKLEILLIPSNQDVNHKSTLLPVLWPTGYKLQVPQKSPPWVQWIWLSGSQSSEEHLTQFSRSVVSDSLWPRVLQHTGLPCPSPMLGTCSNSCPSNRWCHPAILSSVILFSSCLQTFSASGSFPMSLVSGGQSIEVSASALVSPINIQDWFPLGLTGWNSW